MSDTAGRPRKYEDAEEFASMAEAYFERCAVDGKMPTQAGLCLFLGFVDKQSFVHYATYGDVFSLTVKKAQLRIEEDRHQRLANAQCTGTIFDLKVNHGWVDKTHTVLEDPNGKNPFASLMEAVQGAGRPKPGDQS